MLLNIFLVKELRTRIYQQFLAVLAIADLIKTSSWFLSLKYTAPYNICAVQEYWFQFGGLAQALTAVLICFVSYYVVFRRKVPRERQVLMYFLYMLGFTILSFSVNIRYKTARLFCSGTYSGFYEEHFITELYIYSFTSLFPIMGSVLLNLISYFAISNRFRKMNVVMNLKASNSPLHVLVYRLRAYPVIFSICYIPLLCTYIATTIAGDFSLVLGSTAAVGMSSLGAAMSINYFYYQKTLSPFVEKCVFFWRACSCGADSDKTRERQANLSYYPGDDNLSEPALGYYSDEENDQLTFTRYYPSIDMNSEEEATFRTQSSGDDTRFLLTVD